MAKAKVTTKFEKVEIASIRRDEDLQARVAVNEDAIEDYAALVKKGTDLGAPVVFFDGELYWLADGFHRVAAHEACGRKAVRCAVKPGGKRDAILYACSANADFGLRRTNADKRRAIGILLADPEWREWSDNAIATACAVSRELVVAVKASTGVSASSTVVKSADGKERDVSGIAKSNHERAVKKKAEKTSGTATPEALSGPTKPRVTRDQAHEVPDDDVPTIPVEREDGGELVEDGAMAHADDDGPTDELEADGYPSEQDDAVEPPAPAGPTDEAGNLIPAHLRPVFALYAPTGEVERLLTQAAGEFRVMYKAFVEFVKKGGTDAEAMVKGFETNALLKWFDDPGPSSRRQLVHDIRSIAPSIVCQTCEGEGCHECADRGWLSQSDAKSLRHGNEIRESVR